MRNQLSDPLAAYVSDEERSKFNAALDEAESWLYGDGSEANKSAYVKKLNDLKALGDPIRRRAYEFEHKDAGVTALKSSINQSIQWAYITTQQPKLDLSTRGINYTNV